jgi:hypothetical protein
MGGCFHCIVQLLNTDQKVCQMDSKMWYMSGIYNNILNVQDIHIYYSGNIQISRTAFQMIRKPKKFISGVKEVFI